MGVVTAWHCPHDSAAGPPPWESDWAAVQTPTSRNMMATLAPVDASACKQQQHSLQLPGAHAHVLTQRLACPCCSLPPSLPAAAPSASLRPSGHPSAPLPCGAGVGPLAVPRLRGELQRAAAVRAPLAGARAGQRHLGLKQAGAGHTGVGAAPRCDDSVTTCMCCCGACHVAYWCSHGSRRAAAPRHASCVLRLGVLLLVLASRPWGTNIHALFVLAVGAAASAAAGGVTGRWCAGQLVCVVRGYACAFWSEPLSQ